MLISSNLRAIELSQICQNGSTASCYINTIYGEVTNNDSFIFGGNNSIQLSTGGGIDTFINYGILSNTGGYERSFYWSGGNISNIINYGTMGGIGGNRSNAMPMSVTNYGFMFGGIDTGWGNADITINNYGIIGRSSNMGHTYNLGGNGQYYFIIKNYTMIVAKDSTTFNNAGGNATDSSQLVIDTAGQIKFFDSTSKMILDFGNNFELGKEYSLDKLVIRNDSNGTNALGVDFSRLSTRNDIYTLSKSGDNFIVSMNPQYGTMGMLYKSNIKTMINLYLQSNNMIYPHKYKKKRFGNANPPRNNYRRVRGMSNLFYNPTSSLRESASADSWQSTNKSNESKYDSWIASGNALAMTGEADSSLRESASADSWQSTNESNESKWIASGNALAMTDRALIASYSTNTRNDGFGATPLESNELFFYDNEWLLSRDNANARKVNMDYTHSVKAVNNSNVSKDAYYNKGAYKHKIITNDTRSNEINQYQSTNRQGNVSRAPNQNNRHLANQSNNPCGTHKCIYIYKPKQTQQIQQPESKPLPQPTPKVIEQPKVVEPQPKVEPKIQPQPKPIQAIRPTMPPPPKVEPKIEPKALPKVEPKAEPKIEPKPEPKVVKVEPKPTPPKPKVIIEDPYYFILTPFVAHNFFYESGRYNVSGLEYGFITAFSGKITNEHILGLHFAFSYGSLKDSVDSIFNITSMNIMGGLNYKFDITNDMYLKARVDIFYFLNQVQSTMTSGNIIKPNNLGFGASVAYGKEWDFDRNGILGLEVALDYKGLMGNAFSLTSFANTTASYVDSYDKALYNMLYVDLGVNYDKYFESSVGKWGLDTGLGIKGNITANALAKSKVSAHNNARITNMTLDNDRFIAYLNIGGSYLLESKDYDMEFSLAYYGNYGDRTMSNGGGFEWRTTW